MAWFAEPNANGQTPWGMDASRFVCFELTGSGCHRGGVGMSSRLAVP